MLHEFRLGSITETERRSLVRINKAREHVEGLIQYDRINSPRTQAFSEGLLLADAEVRKKHNLSGTPADQTREIKMFQNSIKRHKKEHPVYEVASEELAPKIEELVKAVEKANKSKDKHSRGLAITTALENLRNDALAVRR